MTIVKAAEPNDARGVDVFGFIARFAPTIFLLVLMAMFAIIEPRFLSSINLFNVMRQVSITGLLAIGMVEADVDDVPIDFLGMPVRVTGYPRDDLERVVRDAGFEVLQTIDLSYAPVTTQALPEVQLFLYCRRLVSP